MVTDKNCASLIGRGIVSAIIAHNLVVEVVVHRQVHVTGIVNSDVLAIAILLTV